MLSKEQIKLHWLVRVRWGAVGAWSAVAFVTWWSQLVNVTVWPLVLFLCLTAGSNFLLPKIPTQRERFLKWGGSILATDILLLTSLLFCYGGYANPFSMMFLVYVTLAAFILNAAWTWWSFGISSVAFTTLFFFHIPLPGLEVHHHGGGGFNLHLHGMLIAFLVIGALISLFLTRMSRELDEQAEDIQHLKQQRVLEEKFLAIATLAAGAAHELSTPIGTLSLIVDELSRELRTHTQWGGDIREMSEQIQRCNSILNKMRGEASREFKESLVECDSHSILKSIEEQFRGSPLSIRHIPGPFVAYRGALIEVISSLVKNALQASNDGGVVELSLRVCPETVEITVNDSGQGMSEEEVARVGEPFYTTKAPGEGFGLGLFLVKMFAQRMSGTFSVQSEREKGTSTMLTIPRKPRMIQEAA